MPSITLKAIPKSVHSALKARAKRHKRSLNQEMIAVLEESVAPSRKVDVEAMIARAKRFRESLKFTTTAEEIDRFKRMGRE
ncbi:MAG: Arc family DNA-binding protein [Verrucomicrobiota bacterium]